MKKKFLLAIAALMIFGLAIAAYAFQAANASTGIKASCCAMADCCKDGHCKMGGSCCDGSCPMKDKQSADTTSTINMSKVVVAGGDGNSCCQPGADCCKGGSCCHKKTKG
jgi:hypothetical protein